MRGLSPEGWDTPRMGIEEDAAELNRLQNEREAQARRAKQEAANPSRTAWGPLLASEG